MAGKPRIEAEIGLNTGPWVKGTNLVMKSATDVSKHIKNTLGTGLTAVLGGGPAGAALKETLIGAVGLHTIKELVSSAMDFGNEVKDMSEELGVSIDRAVQLRNIMLEMGKSPNDLVTAMSHFQQFMAEAQTDTAKMAALSRYGFSQQDVFGEFNFDKALTKFLQGVTSDKEGQAKLDARTFLGKSGVKILEDRDKFLQTTRKSYLTEQELKEVEELTAKFRELKDVISMLTIKGLGPFAGHLVRLLNIATGRATKKDLTELPQGVWRMFELVSPELLMRKIFRGIFGMFSPSTQAAKHEGTITPTLAKPNPLGPMEAGQNPFLAIGGLLGVNIDYRIFRIQQDIVRNTGRTADAVEKIAAGTSTTTPPTNSPLPGYEGRLNELKQNLPMLF